MSHYIIIKKKRYYFYDSYPSWRKAYNTGRYYNRKHGSKWYILKKGNVYGKKYELYLHNIEGVF